MTATVDEGLSGVEQAGYYYAENFVYQISGTYCVTSIRLALAVVHTYSPKLAQLTKISWLF